jgi:hypothetical protein
MRHPNPFMQVYEQSPDGLMFANALYNTFKESLLNKIHDMNTDNIGVYLVDSADYTFSAAHDETSGGARDLALAAIVSTFTPLLSPTITSGLFDTADFAFVTVSGDPSEALVLYNDTLTNDPPVAFYDTGMTGMPVTPNGGNINVTVNASGWFTL